MEPQPPTPPDRPPPRNFLVPLPPTNPAHPTHHLHFTLHPSSSSGSTYPLTIIFPGVTCSKTQWASVLRLLPPQYPVLTYERAGYGLSTPSPSPPTAENIVLELYTALGVFGVEGEVVLVGHSFGGVLVREFIHLLRTRTRRGAGAGGRGEVEVEVEREGGEWIKVAGVVFADANQEKNHILWPNPSWDPIVSRLDFWADTGIKQETKLTEEEWTAMLTLSQHPQSLLTAKLEMDNYIPNQHTLAQKGHFTLSPPLLGDIPFCVLKAYTVQDHQRLYEEGVRRGYGTEKEREEMREKLGWYEDVDRGLQRELLKLGSGGRWVETRGSGHWVHMTEPEAVCREVGWVVEEVVRGGGGGWRWDGVGKGVREIG